MNKEIEIDGCVSIQNDLTHDEFLKKFINFIETNGWYFGGGTRVYIDDEYVDE